MEIEDIFDLSGKVGIVTGAEVVWGKSLLFRWSRLAPMLCEDIPVFQEVVK
jgi:hypothetical protein